ncbi:hypothetical protein BOX15_Mlig015523g2, partial [Macrostomum lignano]
PCKQQLAMSLNLATESSEKNELAGQPSFQSISEFYAGKNVLITGITGFLGKVLLEKLLWSCPQIGHIFALMRPKRGESIGARLDSLLASRLFDRLRQDRPDFRSQISPLQGDLFEPNLGLSQKDIELLIRNVSIVFHSAATVRFDEHLKIAVQMNLEGPKKVAELCERMPHLEALVHVSTAYANCDRRVVEEAVYAPEVHPQKLLDAIEWMDDDVLEQVTPRLLGQKPNTYTFTKQLAEFYLTDRFSHLPIVIVRPSIVGASWQEPLPGWVDNFNGPTGVFAAISKGLLRMMQGDVRCKADIIPVDIATNIIISSVWNFRLFSRQATVYNAGVGPGNRLTWGDVERITPEYFVCNPTQSVIRLPKASFTTNSLWCNINWLFNHQLPACLMDLWMYASGRRTVFVRVSNRIRKSTRSLDYFTSREWVFNNTNVLSAMDRMSPSDRLEFDCDASKVDWRLYLERYCTGVKQYALKEDLDDNGSARAHIRKLQRLSLMWNVLLCVLVWRFTLKRVPLAHTMWVLMLNLAMSLFEKLPRLARS